MSRGLLTGLCSAFLLLTGCTNDLSLTGTSNADSTDSATSEDLFREIIRLDIHPISAPSANEEPLLPQSFWLAPNESWSNLRLTMQPTVTVTGTITGFSANPQGIEPSVPGEDDLPVAAQIELYQPDTIAAAEVSTDDDGFFSLQVPAGTDYRLVVRPSDASHLPLYIFDGLELSGDVVDLNALLETEYDEALILDYADPVYGRLLQEVEGGEIGLSGAQIRLIDAVTGEPTSAVQTDPRGYYSMRAVPGKYILEVLGSGPETIPTERLQLSFEDGIGGGQFDINLGNLRQVFIGGSVRSAAGAILSDATVRLTSTSLSTAEGNLVVEDQTNNNGDFLVRALPGEWTVEVIPFNESQSSSSPTEFALTVGDDDLTIPVDLPQKISFSRQVLNVSGQPASNAVITFIQQGFNGTTINTQTDAGGVFSADLPDVPMTAFLTPTNDPDSAITRQSLLSPLLDPSLEWSLANGAAIDGIVRIDGATGESAVFLLDVYNANEELYGSLMTTPNESGSSFMLRVDLSESR
jgi:hypothetical protein